MILVLQAAKGDEAHRKRVFDITGRPMRNWVVVGSEGVEDND